MTDFSVFKGRRVFVTGDTGFKGSWLALWLHSLGAETTGYALPPERDSDLFNLLNLSSLIRHIDGDVRDGDRLDRAVEEAQPSILFHLAAQSLVRRSYRQPKQTFDTNVGGTINILEAARRSRSAQAVVVVTSDKCYKNKEWVWGYRENDELGGRDPYSASKAAAEHVVEAYLHLFAGDDRKLGAATARAGNVIGGGDRSEDRIFPDCIAALESSRPLNIRNPKATRPWQHVLEPLSGYLLLATQLLNDPARFSGAWNFGPRSDAIRTVDDVAREIVSCWESGDIRYDIKANAPHEAGLLHLNCDKALAELAWKPRWPFERAVAETVDWYRHVGQGAAARNECQRQIREHTETA